MSAEEPRSFGDNVGKKRLDLTPVAAASADVSGSVDDVATLLKCSVDRGDIDFVGHEHGCEAFVRRNPLERNSRRRRKSGGAAVAQLLASLHVPIDLVLRHAEIMLQNTSHPEGSGLLVFADADALARHVARLSNTRIDMVRELRMHESSGRKHR